MTEWAIGSLAAYNALPAATQARFAARYDTMWGVGAAIDTLEAITIPSHLFPDDYRFVYIEDVTETNNGGSTNLDLRNYIAADLETGQNFLEITALNRGIVVTMQYFATCVLSDYYYITHKNNAVKFIIHGFTIRSSMRDNNPGPFMLSVRLNGKYSACDIYDMAFEDWQTTIAVFGPVAGVRFCSGLTVACNIWHEVNIWNCIFYQCRTAFRTSNQLVWVGQDPNAYLTVENCVAHSCVEGFESLTTSDSENNNANSVIRNCVAFDSQVSAPQGSLAAEDWGTDLLSGNITVQNCADSDGTLDVGTNTKNNIVPAEEFQSLVYGDPNYLRLKVGSVEAESQATPVSGRAPLAVSFRGAVNLIPSDGVLGESGTEPSIAGDTDFDGNPRPGISGNYAIGAFERTYLFPNGQVLS